METPVVEPATSPSEPSPAPAAPAVSGALLSGIRVMRPNDPPKEPEAPKAPDAVVETEKPKDGEPLKPEPIKAEIPEDPTKGLSEPAAKKFKSLEKHKIQAEQERDEARKQLESVRKEHEALKTQAMELDRLRKDAEKAIEESKVYQAELRKVSLERDPEFKKQYDGQILSRQHHMLDMAVASGASQDEFVKAINSGNEEALEAIRESLPPAHQRIWDANRTDIDRLARERRSELSRSDEALKKIEDNRASSFASMAKDTVDSLFRSPEAQGITFVSKDEVQKFVTEMVLKASQPQLMEQLAGGLILRKFVDGQNAEIDRINGELAERSKEIDDLKEKLSEQETFIKEMSSRTPRITPGGNSSPADQNGTSLLSNVRVRLPGR